MQSQLDNLPGDLLLAVKKGKTTTLVREQLCALSYEELCNSLDNDTKKITFWINSYNAYYQLIRQETDYQYPDVFTTKWISIADLQLSLDDIEHGVLRLGKYKTIPATPLEKVLRDQLIELTPSYLDPRIHFALNCGAKSCPPIAYYTTDQLDFQLSMATTSFLASETTFDYKKRTIYTSQILEWYIDDLGGQKGISELLEKYAGINVSGCKIKYKPYVWDDHLENYI